MDCSQGRAVCQPNKPFTAELQQVRNEQQAVCLSSVPRSHRQHLIEKNALPSGWDQISELGRWR